MSKGACKQCGGGGFFLRTDYARIPCQPCGGSGLAPKVSPHGVMPPLFGSEHIAAAVARERERCRRAAVAAVMAMPDAHLVSRDLLRNNIEAAMREPT